MQASTIFIPMFFIFLPMLLMASNTDEKIIGICASEDFKDFPDEELGDCFDYGKEVHSKTTTILLCIMTVAIAVTILLELKGGFENHSTITSKNPLSGFNEARKQ